MVETTDLVFAVDSIPAIFAITADPFLIFTSNVFARPGAPVIRQWPPEKSVISTCSITSCCPTITFESSLPIERWAERSRSRIC